MRKIICVLVLVCLGGMFLSGCSKTGEATGNCRFGVITTGDLIDMAKRYKSDEITDDQWEAYVVAYQNAGGGCVKWSDASNLKSVGLW